MSLFDCNFCNNLVMCYFKLIKMSNRVPNFVINNRAIEQRTNKKYSHIAYSECNKMI